MSLVKSLVILPLVTDQVQHDNCQIPCTYLTSYLRSNQSKILLPVKLHANKIFVLDGNQSMKPQRLRKTLTCQVVLNIGQNPKKDASQNN